VIGCHYKLFLIWIMTGTTTLASIQAHYVRYSSE
jgi:hypothetical protein